MTHSPASASILGAHTEGLLPAVAAACGAEEAWAGQRHRRTSRLPRGLSKFKGAGGNSVPEG